MEYTIKTLDVTDIKPDKNQPRKTFDNESLQHLAESILSNGLLNPIEVDEDYMITDGERRWRACKMAGLKTISARIVKNKDKTDKLRRQLIFTLQDEEIPTEEKYSAIVKLWESENPSQGKGVDNEQAIDWCKHLGINISTLRRAINYIDDKRQNPKAVEGVSAGVWREIRSLPEKEREEIKEKIKTKEPYIELVKAKREEIKQKEIIEKQREELEKNKSAKEVKIITDREKLYGIRDEIISTQRQLQRLMVNVNWIRKKRIFYFAKPKEKDNFLRFLEVASSGARKWADDLDELRENIQLEIMRE